MRILRQLIYEPRFEKTGLQGFRPGLTQIRLYSHRRCRVATVREKSLENEIFSRSGKSQGISILVRKLRKNDKSQGKVREFEKFSKKSIG